MNPTVQDCAQLVPQPKIIGAKKSPCSAGWRGANAPFKGDFDTTCCRQTSQEITMSKTIQVSDELAQLLGPDERLPQAFTEAVVLELFRERRISAGKASELLRLSYREFL